MFSRAGHSVAQTRCEISRRSGGCRAWRLWLSAGIVAIGLFASISAGAEASTADGQIRGVNMRLVPYLNVGNATPADELIRLNDARLDLVGQAGFSLVRIGVPMEPWIEKVSAAEQAKTLRLLREVLSSASARGLSAEVALFVPARQIVCEDQYRDPYRSGMRAVLAELPDRPDAGIEVVNEPPNCGASGGAIAAWTELQSELYRIVRSIKPHLRFVVAGGGWGRSTVSCHSTRLPTETIGTRCSHSRRRSVGSELDAGPRA